MWEDEKGKVWLAFPRMSYIAEAYGLALDPVIEKMQELLEDLAKAPPDFHVLAYPRGY